MKFAFIAKYRGIWPVGWLCGALGVSRAGYYAWLTRPPSRRSRSDEALSIKVRASFLASDRTYGARRVWHDMIAVGIACGPSSTDALQARDTATASAAHPDERQATAVAHNARSRLQAWLPTANGLRISRISDGGLVMAVVLDRLAPTSAGR